MLQRDTGDRDRGLSIVAIVSMVAVALLGLCVLLVVVVVLGIGLFGMRTVSGPSGSVPISVTPVASP